MGSLILDVLRKGIWSSFTGGWYYDPSSATFTNTFHLYLFLFFLCFPFSVYVYLPRNSINWLIYTSVIGCLFIAIKFINIGLHRMFDTSECIVEEPSSIDIQLECDKRKPNQKTEVREEEGIELQVLGSDKKQDVNQTENNSSFGSIEFADFNSTAVKEEQVTTSGTIDLKVDVHRKNSSDSSEGTFFRSDRVLVLDESNSQESSKEKISSVSDQKVPDVTSSEEVLVSKDLNLKITRKRNLGAKENASQDVSTAVDVSDENDGRLSERSRQYSVSVTLGEETENTNTNTDPTPARSMQLNSEYDAESKKSPSEKGLIYWKKKWNQNPRRSRPNVNATLPPDIAGPSSPRRSSSPLSIYTSDIVYPIAEHNDEQPISSIKRSSAHSDDDDDDDDEEDLHDDDDDDYGDIDDDLDIEMDDSHSPLLAAKHISSSENNGGWYHEKVVETLDTLCSYLDSL